MGGGTEEATAPPEIEGGVLVSAFDYSADNFFAAMEEIAALCGASGEDEGFEATEVQRFSPIITFLKEWRYFCYEPRIINFAHETESKEAIDVAKGISLPQFSSAAVPKMEQFPDRTILLESNDFVLHAGGPVWALDWCPRVPEKSNNIKCEYLAVSAHPPGSAYHKIGVPLIGRGVIQIWCLMNMDEKAEFLPPWPKGGGICMKKPFRKEQMNNLSGKKMVSTAVRPRGRPRKRPLEKEPLCASDAEGEFYLPRPRGRSEKKPDLCVEVPKDIQELPLAKPRGRPRKRPNLGLNVLESSSFASPVGIPGKQPLPDVTNLNGKKESPSHSISLTPHRMLAPSADLGSLALSLPAAAELTGKEESCVPRRRGRPRKNTIPNVNDYAPASGVELGEDASILPTSGSANANIKGQGVDLDEVALALPSSTDLNGKEESVVPSCRVRPRKVPILSGNECAPASGYELQEGASALATSRIESSSLNDSSIYLMDIPLALHASADIRGKEESSVPRFRGRPRKKPIPDVNECISATASVCKIREDTSALATSRGVECSSLNGLSIDLMEIPLALLASADLRGKEELSVPRCGGRPRKKPIPNVKESVPSPAPCCELWEDASALATSRRAENSSLNDLSIDLEDKPLALLASTDLRCTEESSVSKRSGRLIKKPLRYVKECVPAPASGCELREDASALATSRGVESSSLNGLSVDLMCNPLALLPPSDLKCKEESSVPRRRGRPRKKPIRYVKECVPAPASGCELWEDAAALATSRGVESSSLNGSSIELVDIPLALHVSADLGGKEELSVPRCRRRPRKKPIPNVKECVPAPGVELRGDASGMPISRGLKNSSSNCSNVDLVEVPSGFLVPADLKAKDELFVPMCSGRQGKKPFPILNECVQASGVELREHISALPISRGLESSSLNALTVNLQEVPLALPASADSNCKDESLVPSCRGRPRKKPIPNLSESVRESSVEFREDVSVLPNSRGYEKPTTTNRVSVDSEEVALVLPVSTDLKGTEELSVHRCRGRRKKEPTPNANECIRASGTELGEDACAILNHGKQSSVTVEPTHGNHCQDEMVVSKEIRSSNANTTNSVVPKVIALPRVVLCLAHNGKVAWDVKWRPSNGSTSEGKHHMGYLAVLLGNGSLEVWEVPLPSIVKILYASSCNEGTDPRFLKLDPVFRCSKVKCGDRQSIPLTVEWSPSGLSDLILAGCHDGTVAMWKFSANNSSLDTKPLLCFTADSVPIRALAWAPEESDAESTNLIATAGHDGLKFWDIRDPYRPLWDFNPVQRVILSLDWSKDPRSIILSFDDGTLRTISLWKTANDVPVTGKSFIGTKQQGMHVYQCSSSAIWSVQVSRSTGLVSYCSADGSALCFQLTAESVDKGSTRYRQPHFLCGSLGEENKALKISTPSPNAPQRDISFSLKKSLSNMGDAPRTISTYLSERVNSQMAALCSADNHSMFLGSGGSQTPPVGKTPSKSRSSRRKKPKSDDSATTGQALVPVEANQKTSQSSENQDGEPNGKIEVLPAKIVAMHRVRWNMNKGSERWLCYGGAAGIVRCQKIDLPTMPIRSIKPVNLRHHA